MNLGQKVFFLALFAVCTAAAVAQDEVIKVNTTLVSVPVTVSDRQGRYVADLKASDFTLQRDGTNQKIDFFASVEEPINVALLIDTSHSTEPVIDDIKKAAERFVKLLGPRDKAAVVSFDYEPHVLSSLTSDAGQLNKAIKKAEIPRPPGTTLRDAVYQTVKEFAGVTGRKAIILLTDGKDVGSDISTPDLLYSLEESDVMVYSVMFKTGEFRPQFRGGGPGMGGMGRGGMGRGGIFGGRFPGNDPPPQRRDNPQRRQHAEAVNERAEEFLQDLSDTTAGRFYQSKSSEFKDTFALIVDELRHQYRLGFYPPEETADATEHDLRVKVLRQDVAVRSRASYRATPSTGK